jgi:phage tail tape-measure protein
MANRNISATVQIGATMASSVGSVFGRVGKQINSLGSSLAKIKRQSADITRLQAAQGKLAEAKAKGNAAATARYSAQIEKLSTALKAAGVDTSRLTSEQARLASAISSSEAKLASLTRVGASMNRIRASATGVGSAFANVRGQVMGLTTKLTALGAVTGYLFKTQFVDTAAEFERLQTILTTLEGGNVTKAKQAFGWISEFAATTPYDIKQVSEAFVRLRAYGIDPIKGDTLRTLGDTAASMGKDVMSAVEAIADAVTGENERLKEFGIKAAKQGGQIIYSYTDRAGKQRQKAVDAGNRELIRSTLTAIWNEKYAGAMEAQSKTWAGMMSNMGDQWTRFTSSVMAAGLFDWMKTEVGGILEELNKAAADGRLQTWAKQTGTAIKDAFISLKEFAIEAKAVVVSVKNFAGGWKNLGIAIGAVTLLPTIASVTQLGFAVSSLVFNIGALIGPSVITGLATLGTTMKSLSVATWAAVGPWGLLAAGIIAVGAVIYTFKDEIIDLIDSAINPLLDALREIGAWFADSKVGKFFGLDKYNIDGTPQAQKGAVDAIVPFKSTESMKTDLMRSIMPAENMPAAGATNNVKQDFQINVTAPSADPAAVGGAIKSALKSMKLYDTTGTLVPQ